MTWLSDEVVGRLRDIAEQPDLNGTRYELVRELGRGGMGIVYEVYDRELARNVAMKVLEAGLTPDAEWRNEARIIAALEHPGIVPVHDAGVLPDGRVYYTMRAVRGVRLDEWARHDHPRTERLRLFTRICEPVAFAHARDVVHRDLKPANVMVGELGSVLVMDWGVARGADEVTGEAERLIVGTPGYMAPEQQRGADAGARSDVYSLGAVLSFLLRDGDLSRPLRAIVEKSMAADPERRYRDAEELREDLLRFLDGAPVGAYRENIFELAGRWMLRNQVLLVLVAAYLVMRAIVFFWMRL